jgi:hypothetical protein
MLIFNDYSAVIVKSFSCNNLRANDYSAVIVKCELHKDLRKIASILAIASCARAERSARRAATRELNRRRHRNNCYSRTEPEARTANEA